jgi:hypothetical protein
MNKNLRIIGIISLPLLVLAALSLLRYTKTSWAQQNNCNQETQTCSLVVDGQAGGIMGADGRIYTPSSDSSSNSSSNTSTTNNSSNNNSATTSQNIVVGVCDGTEKTAGNSNRAYHGGSVKQGVIDTSNNIGSNTEVNLRSLASTDPRDISTCIRQAADAGEKVINLSVAMQYSGTTPLYCNGSTIADSVNYAASKGSVIVMAAGNGLNNQFGTKVVTTCDKPDGVIVVGGTNADGTPFGFQGSAVDVYLKGVDIKITNYPNVNEGTSHTAPQVSALVAAMLKSSPTLTASQIVDIIKSSGNVNSKGALIVDFQKALDKAKASIKLTTPQDIQTYLELLAAVAKTGVYKDSKDSFKDLQDLAKKIGDPTNGTLANFFGEINKVKTDNKKLEALLASIQVLENKKNLAKTAILNLKCSAGNEANANSLAKILSANALDPKFNDSLPTNAKVDFGVDFNNSTTVNLTVNNNKTKICAYLEKNNEKLKTLGRLLS